MTSNSDLTESPNDALRNTDYRLASLGQWDNRKGQVASVAA
jgi:hypothetical protein